MAMAPLCISITLHTPRSWQRRHDPPLLLSAVFRLRLVQEKGGERVVPI